MAHDAEGEEPEESEKGALARVGELRHTRSFLNLEGAA
jgi:hypothetical protein